MKKTQQQEHRISKLSALRTKSTKQVTENNKRLRVQRSTETKTNTEFSVQESCDVTYSSFAPSPICDSHLKTNVIPQEDEVEKETNANRIGKKEKKQSKKKEKTPEYAESVTFDEYADHLVPRRKSRCCGDQKLRKKKKEMRALCLSEIDFQRQTAATLKLDGTPMFTTRSDEAQKRNFGGILDELTDKTSVCFSDGDTLRDANGNCDWIRFQAVNAWNASGSSFCFARSWEAITLPRNCETGDDTEARFGVCRSDVLGRKSH